MPPVVVPGIQERTPARPLDGQVGVVAKAPVNHRAVLGFGQRFHSAIIQSAIADGQLDAGQIHVAALLVIPGVIIHFAIAGFHLYQTADLDAV